MMQFVLTGFTHDMGFRVFTFEGVQDRIRTLFTVKADLALIRVHGSRMQELPLLCRALLDRGEPNTARAFVFTEDDMRVCAQERAADAAQRRKPPRRPPVENLGSAWRGPQS